MLDDLISIQNTEYNEYFENAEENTVFLLSTESGEQAWNSEVHANSWSYFNLPDDCWIVANKAVSIGEWIEAYNSNNTIIVAELLRAALDWSDDAIVRFFINQKNVLQTRWCDFLRFWDEFIMIEDDCPILIPKNNSGKEAIVFTPLGDILKIG